MNPELLAELLAALGLSPDASEEDVRALIDEIKADDEGAEAGTPPPPTTATNGERQKIEALQNRVDEQDKQIKELLARVPVTEPLANRIKSPDGFANRTIRDAVDELRNSNPNLSFQQAWDQLRRTKPELFQKGEK